MSKKILVLGGYGGVGRTLCHELLKNTNVDIVVAGRNPGKAESFASILVSEFGPSRISFIFADASDYSSLEKAFSGCNLIIFASNTPHLIDNIAKAALKNNCDYLDIMVDYNVIDILKSYNTQIINQKSIFITQAGFHPGLPAVLVRLGAAYFDKYSIANISMMMNARFEKPESAIEVINMIGENNGQVYINGAWRAAGYKDMKTFNFGNGYKSAGCYPIMMEELRELPAHLGLAETGCYVAGFNWFVDYFVTPLIFLSYKIKKGFGATFLGWMLYHGINLFSPVKPFVVFQLDASGEKDGLPAKMKIRMECGNPYLFTAIPVVCMVKQYLQGKISKPGLYLMGNAAEPANLLDDMEKMDIEITKEVFIGKVLRNY